MPEELESTDTVQDDNTADVATAVTDDSGDQDDQAASSDTEWRDALQAETGVDLSKYSNDAEARKGLAEAAKMVGQKNEDAAKFRALVNQLRANNVSNEDIQTFLGGTVPTREVEPAGDSVKYPTSFDEYLLLESKVIGDDGNVKPGVDPNDVRRLQATQKRLHEHNFRETFREPEARGMSPEEVAVAMEARDDQFRRQAILDENADMLYVDGDPNKGITSTGQQVIDYIGQIAQGGNGDTSQLKAAIEHVQLTIDKPKSTKRVKSTAKRKVGVKASAEEFDKEKFFRDGGKPSGLVAMALEADGK